MYPDDPRFEPCGICQRSTPTTPFPLDACADCKAPRTSGVRGRAFGRLILRSPMLSWVLAQYHGHWTDIRAYWQSARCGGLRWYEKDIATLKELADKAAT